MSWNIEDIIRDNIRHLAPYSSARDEFSGSASVYLDANESPYNEPLNRYPDPYQEELKRKISKIKGPPQENIFLGNGSDEAIDLLFRIFCEPGIDNAIAIAPSYGMYQVCGDINNVEVRKVLLNSDFSLDADRIIAAADNKTKLVFLCSPNNPTSNLLSKESMLKIAESLKAVVIVDEAYIDYSEKNSLLPYIKSHSNLVILQTLSKAWALAGIRLGMAMGDKSIITYLSKVKYPYNINRLTIQKAIAELTHGDIRNNWVREIVQERKHLANALMTYTEVEQVYPSDANFLLVKVKNPQKMYFDLLKSGIIVRDRSNVPLCEGCLRITVGTPEENRQLLDAMKLLS